MRIGVILVLAIVLTAQPALAVVTFTQLDDDVFTVSHRIKLLGGRGRAMKMVYVKASSLCVAAGFAHYKVLGLESNAFQEHDTANASVQVQFFQEDGEGRIDCDRNADPKYVDQARQKLSKRGYNPPSRVAGN